MKTRMFRVVILPDESGGYYGFVPLLRGLHTQGDTIEEMQENLREAIICHVQGLVKDKQPIPEESRALESIQTFSDQELAIGS